MASCRMLTGRPPSTKQLLRYGASLAYHSPTSKSISTVVKLMSQAPLWQVL